MFPKPAFGANSSSFGSFSSATTAASPFGGFKPATGSSAFGAPPAFGASAAAQPAAGGGLFGSTSTTGGLFGAPAAAAAPAFGAPGAGFGFGPSTSAGGLFASNTTSTGLFGGAQNTSAFGAKPAGFGFGGTTTGGATSGGLFGSTAAGGAGLFGQQSSALGGGGLFSNTGGAFGQQPAASGTAHVKYNPVVGTDVVVKSGTSQNISIKHHCITCMKEYEGKSLEELRLEDYTAGRKGSASAGMFSGYQQQPEAKPLFGGATFSQPASTTASNVFGGGGIVGGTGGGFGQTNTFSFGQNTQNNTNTTGLFGAAKPTFGATGTTGTGLFGATTTQAPTFGTTSTPSFGFGSNTQNQAGGLFGTKPVTAGFGATPASSGFGSFGTGGGLFAAKPQQSTAPAFGSTTPAFGALSGGFGTNTSTSGGLFGANSTFGKPATTQPTFGFNAPTTGLGTGLGSGLGGNAFAPKPAAPAFGTLGGGGLFQTQPQTNFSTGVDSGLGGGIFGNSSALGGSALGLGLGSNTSMTANNTLSGASAAGNVHEQILNLVARPYGDSPLFKDLLPDTSTTAEDALKPTNPAAVKAVLEGGGGAAYRVTSPSGIRLKVQPRAAALTHDKKSLFDGLEESDASLEDKLTLKPSRKRLVLRPRSQVEEAQNDSVEQRPPQANSHHRSTEDPPRDSSGQSPASETQADKENETRREALNNMDDSHRARRDASYGETNNLESRYGSWLSSARAPSYEKEKSIDIEPTPRLYPNLDKELPTHMSERRASWLTTKPLRKPLAANPDAAENSARDLGLRADRSYDKENVDTLSGAPSTSAGDSLQFCCHRWGKQPACSSCEKIAHQIAGVYVSEEEHVAPRDMPPHPTGVKLTRPGYYTIPSLDEMIKYMRQDGSCVVPHLTIGRKNYGNVYYDCEIDVAGLDLDALVHFLNKEVTVYPDDSDKPPVGEGLNRRAIVTLDRVWPRDKTEKRPITDPERLLSMDYEGKLRRVCDKHDTKFIEYRPQTGSWVFRVEHFSKYSLTDSDEEDDPTPEVLKRQLVNQQLQKAAPIAPPKTPATATSSGLGGLGAPIGFSSPGLGGLSSGNLANLSASRIVPGLGEDNLYAMHQTSLNLLNGAGKAFDMDTTEDNTESVLYQDSHRAYGVKSPTSELARLEHRQSHNVQLMKASLYADTEMEDDNTSVSTGDQKVPRGALLSLPARPPSARPMGDEDVADDVIMPPISEEVAMKPLIVRPHTIVLKYHRKVPPFKQTIAGRLEAACIADMSVCRARHSRAGFGPAGAVVFPTSYDSIAELPRNAELCELGRYVRGRTEEDWSEPVVARLALGRPDDNDTLLETLTRQLETLLENSTFSECDDVTCPRLSVVTSPRERRATLEQLTRHCRPAKRHSQFGVSGAYCQEVFRLCEALWGADLENDGVPGTDELSIVSRHRRLLEWLTAAVADATDRDLATPRAGEAEDETDGHSGRVWTLLLGGRVVEACKVARESGDLNMAALMAQAAGDPTFRSLVARQLSLWRECGADALISSRRLAALRLVAGVCSPRDQLAEADWLRALHATARYLCPQVPSLEHVIRTYEGFFGETRDGGDADLSLVDGRPDDAMGMKYPLPPYVEDYDVTICNSGQRRRVLDLRYELMRARAMNARPKLQPAAYTPDPMDYSLCFLLGAWFGNPAAQSITGVAEQLEAAGAWHLAVLALAYHPHDSARGHLIRGVLSRHAPAKADTPELRSRLELVRKLRVPEKWLLEAQAHRAKYEHLPAVEAEHLVGAGLWNAAHKVLLEQLLPEAVLADNLQSISPLLEKLNEAAQRHEVSGWESGGQALHHYLHVCHEIRGLVSSAEADRDRGAVHARLEAVRPRVAAACRALGRLDARSARHAAARTEMGARLVHLALAAGEPPHHLAALLRALKLPPDCTYHAQHKITTDLAEQASELCIESASSSPLSSHHRATVQS